MSIIVDPSGRKVCKHCGHRWISTYKEETCKKCQMESRVVADVPEPEVVVAPAPKKVVEPEVVVAKKVSSSTKKSRAKSK